jgi:hypothetical protein
MPLRWACMAPQQQIQQLQIAKNLPKNASLKKA